MLKIIRAGMYTTVQDGGRHGFRQSGISHCGALDMPALRIANLLVGNDANAPALEITLGQPIHFVQCSLEEALKARQDQQRYFEQLAWRLHNEN